MHVDSYKCRLFHSLKGTGVGSNPCVEGPTFFGFNCGNHSHPGCLTLDKEVRLHSCEFESACPALTSPQTVFITPIISRTPLGESIPELGAGGGGRDLVQRCEIELSDNELVMRLVELCKKMITDPIARSTALERITKALLSETRKVVLERAFLDEGTNIGLMELVQQLSSTKTSPEARKNYPLTRQLTESPEGSKYLEDLPRRIVSNIRYKQHH